MMNANAAAALYLLREVEGGMTTADVADVVFTPDTTEEARNAERKVRYYFEDGYDHLVESEGGDGSTLYDVDADMVWAGHGAMFVSTLDDAAIKIDFGDVLVYIDCDGVPQTVQLDADKQAPTVEPSVDADLETVF